MYEVKNESRALNVFLSALHTDSTKKTYMKYLNKYLEYSGKSNYDELVLDSVETIQKSLEDYLMKLIKIHSYTYLNVQFSALILFFKMNDKNINDLKLKKMIPPQSEQVGGDAYSTEELKRIILSVTPPKNRSYKKIRNLAIIHILASSGCRLGAIAWIRIQDLEPIEDCFILHCYEGLSTGYQTFLTPEASKIVKEYLFDYAKRSKTKGQELKINDYLFPISSEGVSRMLNRIVARSGIRELKANKINYRVPTIHGFRKRFSTIFKGIEGINHGYVELWMGHSFTIPLDSAYNKATPDKMFLEYKKGIAELTIFDKWEKSG